MPASPPIRKHQIDLLTFPYMNCRFGFLASPRRVALTFPPPPPPRAPRSPPLFIPPLPPPPTPSFGVLGPGPRPPPPTLPPPPPPPAPGRRGGGGPPPPAAGRASGNAILHFQTMSSPFNGYSAVTVLHVTRLMFRNMCFAMLFATPAQQCICTSDLMAAPGLFVMAICYHCLPF